MMQAEDDGANAHAVVPGEAPDIRDPQALRTADYFRPSPALGPGTSGHEGLVRLLKLATFPRGAGGPPAVQASRLYHESCRGEK